MPPKAALPVPGLNATEAEIKLAFTVLKFVRRPNGMAIHDEIAIETGSASGDSVRHGVRKAADKHAWFSRAPAEEPGDATATPRPKKAATPRKKKIAEVNEEDEEAGGDGQGEVEGTPKKRRKAKGKAKVKDAGCSYAEHESTSPVSEEE
ncbi:hypothetical protein LZ32DRAFT_618310 [Colletotrichum eremochloae]|nr:hypothetical protein LZ32DRAFT_618310 [Colletotrichum eremochloae]